MSSHILKLNLNRNFKLFRRTYNSESVFGFRAETIRNYEVPAEILEARNKYSNFYRLITAYRHHAHKRAVINPVEFEYNFNNQIELEPHYYGLNETDKVDFTHLLHSQLERGTVADGIKVLQNAYCRDIGVEFHYLESEEEIDWFANAVEKCANEEIDKTTKLKIARELIKSQTFDNFLANKFVTLKRYGGEGAESMMAFFMEFFNIAADANIEQIVLCMPHRGRLNLLTGMLFMPPVKLFRKLKGLPDFPETFHCSGDVISHLISSVDLRINNDKTIHFTMLYNPSHLEAVNSVSMGKTRSKQLTFKDGDYGDSNTQWSDKIINVQIHGDAAYSGQGVNQESLQLSRAPHFEIGGSVHLIVNNQVGFTTPAERGRSSKYCSDIAKSIAAPVIHVNGDYPEEVIKATRIATEYQRKFRKDVFVDLNCFRKWGHNELDDPTFTNPALYKVIQSRMSVPDMYANKLILESIMTEDEVQQIVTEHTWWLNSELKQLETYQPETPCFDKQWTGFVQAPAAITTWDTGVHEDILSHIGKRSVSYPTDFNIHPHLFKTHVNARLKKIEEKKNIDWATAEALAFGSLMYQGYNVRISGQDVGRGTFSHRHAMLVDQETNLTYIPLNDLDVSEQGYIEVANSILSEEAVLGYEYGMSIDNPNNLIIWEAQFGDFFNGAQIMIDTFVTSGETKWLTSSGLVMLLPHGYDGAGPEHSSCKIERFLQLTDSNEDKPDGDDVNFHVVNPTTPAQYFHLLRRQVLRNFRKPLVIIAPKTLLRLSDATSTFSEMTSGTHFHHVIDDNSVDPSTVTKIIFVSGKQFYTLQSQRKTLNVQDTAIVRLECLCPFPTYHLQQIMHKYSNAKVFIWSQEEPRNMGAWSFVNPRFENLIGHKLTYVGRDTAAAPAVGVGYRHQNEVKHVTTQPFAI